MTLHLQRLRDDAGDVDQLIALRRRFSVTSTKTSPISGSSRRCRISSSRRAATARRSDPAPGVLSPRRAPLRRDENGDDVEDLVEAGDAAIVCGPAAAGPAPSSGYQQ
jgi:hypothetical protein